MVYVDQMNLNSLDPVDSTTIDENGKFSLSGNLDQPAFALLRSEDDAYITLILSPGDKVTVTAPYAEMEETHTVSGSEATDQFEYFLSNFRKSVEKLRELNQIYQDSAASPNLESIIADLDTKSKGILEEQRTFTKQFVRDHLNSLASLLVLYQQIAPRQYILDPMEDFEYFELVDSALMKKYPEADAVVSFHTQMTELRQRHQSFLEQEKTVGTGAVAPEIALPGIDGDTIRLSSTRGKYVLLDFWASWCSPCRQENPNLVKYYKQYHNRGFEIFQVSLDNNREDWLKGIQDDHLGAWLHCGDMQYWNSPVVEQYHIQGIPMNFLLDKEGKIIAKNLRGPVLGEKLAELFD